MNNKTVEQWAEEYALRNVPDLISARDNPMRERILRDPINQLEIAAILAATEEWGKRAFESARQHHPEINLMDDYDNIYPSFDDWWNTVNGKEGK